MDINDLKVDAKTIAAGEWVDNIPEMGELRLRVRGMLAPKVQALQSLKLRGVPRKQRGRDGNPTHQATVAIMAEVLFEAVLLDWDGLTSGGKPVPYDAKLAKEWLTNIEFRKFADAVAWAANCVDNGRAQEVEDVAGN